METGGTRGEHCIAKRCHSVCSQSVMHGPAKRMLPVCRVYKTVCGHIYSDGTVSSFPLRNLPVRAAVSPSKLFRVEGKRRSLSTIQNMADALPTAHLHRQRPTAKHG